MFRPLAACSLLVLLLVSACGDDGAATSTTVVTAANATTTTAAPETTTAPVAFPAVVSSDAGQATIEAKPTRIAALSATHVEMLFALGAGDAVIAGDLYSNYPPAAAELILVDSFNLNLEALIELDPDLVILSFDPGEAVAALDAVGIPTLLYGTAADLDDVYDQVAALGAATGHAVEAAELQAEMQAEIAAVVADVAESGRGITYYHETDPFSFYTPNSTSFIGTLYTLLGMENIADAAPDEFSSGFPQLSPEFIIDADPDIVFLGGGFEDATTVAARDGWGAMSAAANGRVVVLDYDIASRWGPRVPEMLRAIADGLMIHASGG